MEGDAKAPRQIWALYLTGDCNLDCSYCYRAGSPRSGRMTFEKAAEVLGFIARHASNCDARSFDIGLFGREPMMEPGLVRFLIERSGLIEYGHSLSINTNGTLLTPGFIRFLRENGVRIALSLDGCRRTHDMARTFPGGASSYDTIQRLFPDLVSYEPAVHVRMTVTPGSAPGFDGDVRHVFEAGFRKVSFSCDLTADGWDRTALALFSAALQRLAVFYAGAVSSGLDIFIPAFDSLARGRAVSPKGLFCGAASFLFSVDTDGVIYPCWRFAGDMSYAMGNVRDGFSVDSGQHPFNTFCQAEIPSCLGCVHTRYCGRCAWDSISRCGDFKAVSKTQCAVSRAAIEAGHTACSMLLKSRAPLFMNRLPGMVSMAEKGLGCRNSVLKDDDGLMYNIPQEELERYKIL